MFFPTCLLYLDNYFVLFSFLCGCWCCCSCLLLLFLFRFTSSLNAKIVACVCSVDYLCLFSLFSSTFVPLLCWSSTEWGIFYSVDFIYAVGVSARARLCVCVYESCAAPMYLCLQREKSRHNGFALLKNRNAVKLYAGCCRVLVCPMNKVYDSDICSCRWVGRSRALSLSHCLLT